MRVRNALIAITIAVITATGLVSVEAGQQDQIDTSLTKEW